MIILKQINSRTNLLAWSPDSCFLNVSPGGGWFERYPDFHVSIFAPQIKDAAAPRTEGNVLHALATGSGKGERRGGRIRHECVWVCVCV